MKPLVALPPSVPGSHPFGCVDSGPCAAAALKRCILARKEGEAMPTINNSTHINAPVEKVFADVTDPMNGPDSKSACIRRRER